ncbi:MAG: hypothetical protein R3D30_00390 [Hyphomicrobiales bacterium]
MRLIAAPEANPIALVLGTAASIDKAAANLMQTLANDPPDGNYTIVQDTPDFGFTGLPMRARLPTPTSRNRSSSSR